MTDNVIILGQDYALRLSSSITDLIYILSEFNNIS